MRTTLGGMFCLASAVGWACSGSLPHPRYMAQPSSALTAVPLPPPPARVELVPPRPPESDAVWIDGEWTFRHGRWAWTLGQWIVPLPDTFFSPWTEVRTADGTLLHAPGVWRDAKGQVIAAPQPRLVATAQAGPVVDAEGVTETTGRTVKPGTAGRAPEASPAPAPTPGPDPTPAPVPDPARPPGAS